MMTRTMLVAALALTACSVKQKKEITDEAMEDPGRRAEIMEAQLRVLDKHPEYVDELFELTLRHPQTLNRFLANTAREVKDPDLAQRVAKQLAAHPRGLMTVLVATIDAANDPAARAAIAEGMETRADQAARILVEHPKQLGTITKAIMKQAMESPNTKDVMKEAAKQMID